MRAVRPVQHYNPAAWEGWTVVSTETVTPPAGVMARRATSRIDQYSPSREASTGKGWEILHLVKAAP
jgi:hypothetical protein